MQMKRISRILRRWKDCSLLPTYVWLYIPLGSGLRQAWFLYEYQPGRRWETSAGIPGWLPWSSQCVIIRRHNKVEDVLLVVCMAHCRRKNFMRHCQLTKNHGCWISILQRLSKGQLFFDGRTRSIHIPAEIGVAYCNSCSIWRKFKI